MMPLYESIPLAVALWGAGTLGVIHNKRLKGKRLSKWDFILGAVAAILTTLFLGKYLLP